MKILEFLTGFITVFENPIYNLIFGGILVSIAGSIAYWIGGKLEYSGKIGFILWLITAVVRFYFYYDKLEECNLMMPSLAEQQKISECIDAMDRSIEIRERELNEEKQKKKALMQLLLTGIVRV